MKWGVKNSPQADQARSPALHLQNRETKHPLKNPHEIYQFTKKFTKAMKMRAWVLLKCYCIDAERRILFLANRTKRHKQTLIA
jgi:hypothetical protein